MYKSVSPFYYFWNWLCIVSDFMARIFTGSAIMALLLWPLVNKVLLKANLPTMPYWWHWCFFKVMFGLKSLFLRKGGFNDIQ